MVLSIVSTIQTKQYNTIMRFICIHQFSKKLCGELLPVHFFHVYDFYTNGGP